VEEAGKVFDSFFRGRKLDPDDRTQLLQDAIKIANGVVAADAAFMKDRQGHLDQGDKVSAVRMTRAKFAQALPDAVKKIARRYGYVSGTPGTATQPNKTGSTPPAGKADAGFVFVNERPSIEQVDRSATEAASKGAGYASMIMAKKAVLVDGRKVDWSRLKV
jgi:hypothetical protein